MTLYEQFVQDVIQNPHNHNQYVRQCVARHIQDIETGQYYFDTEKADRAIKIVKLLRHTSGSFGGKHFDLQPYQAFIIAMLFGWTDIDTGYRRFKKAYIEMARKGGKSELAAAIQIIATYFDNEHAAQVYSVANTRDQAGYVYNAAREMCKALSKDSKSFAQKCRLLHYKILETETNGFITRLTADAGTNDGANPHLAIIDEYHSAKDDSMLKVVETGMGGRTQPLLLIITTAGFNKNGPCYQFRDVVTNMLTGKIENDNLFGIIWTLDEEDDWNDETKWRKANPNIGNTPRWESMRAFYQSAITEGATAEVEFKTKNLNCWVDSAKTWIKDEDWMQCVKDIDLNQLYGQRCFVGMDLSSRTDLTAISYWFPDLNYIYVDFYCPEDKIQLGRRVDGVDYNNFLRNSRLTATPGNTIDYDYIIKDILDNAQNYNIELLGYDPFNADLIIPKITEYNIECAGVRQGYLTLSPATKRLEVMILKKELHHDGDPVLRWNMGNVELETDAAGNIKPSKSNSKNKIDGVAAMVTSIATWMSTEIAPKDTLTLEQIKAMYE
jgi:phage terminase large subunit-like protein